MIDHWFGRVLDALDATGRWDDTAVIVCTDHGHYLGERDLFGKPPVPVRPELGHLPLLVAWPGVAAGVRSTLTTTVDLHATIAEVFGVRPAHVTHGRSLVGAVRGSHDPVRSAVLQGYWGRHVQLIDDEGHYARAPVGDNAPLSLWSNRWSTMPVHVAPDLRLPRPDHRAELRSMPGTDVPVLCQPFGPGDLLPFWAMGAGGGEHLLFDHREDPDEQHDLSATRRADDAVERLRVALQDIGAPVEQLERLGIA
jgi:hypothetical protein